GEREGRGPGAGRAGGWGGGCGEGSGGGGGPSARPGVLRRRPPAAPPPCWNTAVCWPRATTAWAECCMNGGKHAEAEPEYRQSLDIMEKLAAEFPGDSRFEVDFGGCYCNLGNVVRDSGQPEAALGWFQKAIARLEPVLAKESRLVEARQFLRNSHWGKAQALDALGRHAEATRDWERALELDDGHDKEFLRSKLAESRLRRFRKDK